MNPRSITAAERPWVEGFDLDRQADLVAALRAAGQSNEVALALAGWVATKAVGMRDETAAPTRARYRRILAELDPPNGQRPVRRRVGSRAIPGLLNRPGQRPVFEHQPLRAAA